MELLPLELWSHTCTFLNPPDLARLALASSAFLYPVRWHLYRKVILRSGDPGIQDVFRLLLHNAQLCRRIITLVIETSAEWHPIPEETQGASTTWLNLDIFKSMERLRVVKFKRLPCLHVSVYVRFRGRTVTLQDILGTVYRHCPNIEEVALVEVTGPGQHEALTNNDGVETLSRDRLRKVIFKSDINGGIHWPFLLSCFISRSMLTISHLDLAIGRYTLEFSTFASLSFPRLRTLYLRNLPRASSTAVTVFLVKNSSLRYVHLLDSDALPNIEKMNINMLPDLHTISASSHFLTHLAQKCDSLRYIRCLFCEYDGDDSVLDSTKTLTDVTKGFPNLRHISLSRIIGGHLAAQVMTLFHTSVELECWTGGFYFRDVSQLDPIAQALRAFPVLARLDICEWTYPDVMPPTKEHKSALVKIARACPSMKKITLYMSHIKSNEIATIFKVESDLERRLTRRDNRHVYLKGTYQYVDGGPYIQDRRSVDFSSVDWQEEALLLTEN